MRNPKMNKGNKYKTLISNTLIFAVGNILVKFIAFFLMPLYTTYLTTQQYGVSELANSMIEVVLPIATLSMIEALYRFSIDKDADYDELFINSSVVILLGDILVLIGCLIVYRLSAYPYTFHFFVLYVTTTFYKMVTQFARGRGHVKRFAAYGVLNSLLLVLTNIILIVVFKGGVSAYLNSFSIAFGLSGLVAFIASKEYRYIHLHKFNMDKLKEMLRYSMPAIPNMLSWWINSILNRYFVLFFWGASATGIYTAASKLPSMINLVTSIFQQAWQYSTATEIGEKGERTFFSNVLRAYAYICALACAGLIFLNKIICAILLKADFYEAWQFVPILLVAATFGCLSSYFGTFYQALKQNLMLMTSTLIGAGINIIFNLILTPSFGGKGAAFAMLISYGTVTLIRMLDIRKRIHIDILWNRLGLQMGLIIIYGVIASIFEGNLPYVIGIFIMMILVGSDRMILKTIWNLLPMRKKKTSN